MGMWEHGVTLPAKAVKNVGGMLSGTCPGLVEGCEYVFRIKAVNKGGPSLPSPQSESMIAKTRFSKFCKLTQFNTNSDIIKHISKKCFVKTEPFLLTIEKNV